MKVLPYLILLCSSIALCQQTDTVDFLKIEATLIPDVGSRSITGHFKTSFTIKKSTDSIFLDGKNMKLSETKGDKIKISATEDKIWLIGNFRKGSTYSASFTFIAIPKQSLYFTGDQIWTQGQGKYTSHWLPSIDDMNDKLEFDLKFSVPVHKMVISNGKQISETVVGEHKLVAFDMLKPMSSYLVAFALGDFHKQEISTQSGIPMEFYLATKDTAKFEPTYRHSKEIFDFFEAEIGLPYPWQNYKQVPVRDFLYAGMENTTCTIFSEAFVVDKIGFHDRNYLNVNAHELAHQWFGNLVTETSGMHHWLQEGFATYYALLAEREIFGDDYFYWKLYQSAEQLKALSDEGQGQSLLDPSASSLIFYEKGAWALHILKALIGEEAFKNAMVSYLKKYRYKNVSTEDFVAQVKAFTATDISAWEEDWLHQSAFKAEQAYTSLLHSPFIKAYFEVAKLAAVPVSEKKIPLTTALTFSNDYIGQEAIMQLAGEPLDQIIPLYKKGFDSNNLLVRQAIALTVSEVPFPLKTEFESLLEDASYVTQEAALYLLWSSFPEDRRIYLDKMKTIEGFQDKNIRQLWLALASITPAYNPLEKERYAEELRGYTSSIHSFEIRLKAFEYCVQLGFTHEEVILNLVNASVHHNWRFRNAARTFLGMYLENPDVKKVLLNRMEAFSAIEKEYLSRIVFNE